jgi:ankyrin repeat protein
MFFKKDANKKDAPKTKAITTLQKQKDDIKHQVHKAISTDNFTVFEQHMKEFSVDPHEEVSVKGSNWTPLHYAGYFKRPRFLKYLVKLTYEKYPQDYASIINIPTKEGWTPLMICCLYKSFECLKILYLSGGIQPNLKDGKGKDAAKLAEYYGAIECFEHIKKNVAEQIPINEEFIKSEYLATNFKDPTHANLLLNGYRKPCIYCTLDSGYLKYCKQCGAPIHKLCLTDNSGTCKDCGKCCELTGEILFPERAFSETELAVKTDD